MDRGVYQRAADILNATMEYDAPFDPDQHAAEPIPEPGDEWSPSDSDEPYDDPSGYRKGGSSLITAALIVVVLLLAGGAYWWLSKKSPKPSDEPTKVATDASTDREASLAEPVEEAPAASVPLPPLNASDEFVRETAQRLSQHPALVRWLARDDLVRRSVATVENIANGKSPRSHLEFMAPREPYLAHRVEGRLVAQPESYARYDLMVDVFASLDIGTTVQLFHTLEPLLDKAYGEIAPPGAKFRDALAEAIDQLLAVEVPAESPELEEGVLSYRYADPRLEQLSPAEKHLLRLGPERARRVQKKLQFLSAGLDLGPASRQ